MKRKQDLGKWFVDLSKYAVGAIFLGIVLGDSVNVIGSFLLCVLAIVLFFLGTNLQEENRLKKFDNKQYRNPNKPKRNGNETQKSERNRGKKRPVEGEHTPNEIKVD